MARDRPAVGSLGVGATVVILIRGAMDSPTVIPLADQLYETIMLGVSLANTAGVVPPQLAGWVLWLFYLGTFYRMLPTLLPEQLHSLGTDRGLRAIVAILTVVVGLVVFAPVVSRVLTPAMSLPVDRQLRVVVSLLVVATAGMSLYLRVRFTDPLAPSSVLFQALQVRDQQAVTQTTRLYRQAGPRARALGRAVSYTLVGLVFVGVAVALGGVTALLAGFSPLPEVLVIVAALSARLPVHSSRTFGIDIESEIQRRMRVVFLHQKGWAQVPAVLTGVFFAFLQVIGGVSLLSVATVQTLIQAVATSGLQALWWPSVQHAAGMIGSGILVVTAGLLLLWYWLRLITRLPAAVRAWTDAVESTPLRARPPGGGVVPAVLFLLGMSVPVSTQSGAFEQLARTVVGLGWPLGVIVGAGWIRQTTRRAVQPATGDLVVVPLAVGATIVPMAIVELRYAPTSSAYLIMVWLVVAGFSFWPDLQQRMRTTAPLGAVSSALAIVALGGLVLGVMWVLVGTVPVSGVVVGGLFVLAAGIAVHRDVVLR